MRTLHVIRRLTDRFAVEAAHAESGSAVLLIQDAVLMTEEMFGERKRVVFVSERELSACGWKSPFPALSDEEICRMILRHDRVVVW